MRNIAVVARDDGRGEVYPFKYLSKKSYEGETFLIGEYKFEVDNKNRVIIPAEIMNELGYLLKNGKRAINISPEFITVDGDIVMFGQIHRSKIIEKYLQDAYNGGQLPEEVYRPELMDEYERVIPTDVEDYSDSF